jgi:sortase A
MRRIARIVSVSLITAGLVILADAGLTLAWKEPVSAIYSSAQQGRAAAELEEVEEEFLAQQRVSPSDVRRGPRQRARALADALADTVLRSGRPVGRIRAPAAGIDYVVLQGTSAETLRRGPGHYRETSFPAQGATIAIAGHRTTYGAPFHDLHKLETGDVISLEMPYGDFDYEVSNTRIVDPTDTWIVDDRGRERLVLTACHPLFSAAQRYAVFADPV